MSDLDVSLKGHKCKYLVFELRDTFLNDVKFKGHQY